jgi:hypothetical protein
MKMNGKTTIIAWMIVAAAVIFGVYILGGLMGFVKNFGI